MKNVCSLITVIFLLLQTADAQKAGVEKEPAWVSAKSVDYSKIALSNDMEDGYQDLLFEKQINIASQVVYHRRAIRIVTEAGIQNASEVSISFDPAYERLAFHKIQLIRGNQVINKLDLSRIKTIQQETELSMS